jgi:predicted DNA-binding transcriptional regulator AlpA
MSNKRDKRHYSPDFVSADSLAYRLDCSRSTIDEYVRSGLLPPPKSIGNLQRWDFAEVCAFIRASHQHGEGANETQVEDEYFKGLTLASPPET